MKRYQAKGKAPAFVQALFNHFQSPKPREAQDFWINFFVLHPEGVETYAELEENGEIYQKYLPFARSPFERVRREIFG